MGDYILRIKAKPRVVSGIRFHECVYAYKPYSGFGGTHRLNEQMFRRICGPASRAWNKMPVEDRRNVLVSYHDMLFPLKYCDGTIYDFALDRLPIGRVVRPRGRPASIILFYPRTDLTKEQLHDLAR